MSARVAGEMRSASKPRASSSVRAKGSSSSRSGSSAPSGRAQAPADRAVLPTFMGYTAAGWQRTRTSRGDTSTEDMVERINERLGRPDRCPHGWPVEPSAEQAENRELGSLADSSRGWEPIVRLAEHDALCRTGLRGKICTGTHVTVREAQPAAGQFRSSSTVASGRSPRRADRASTCVPPPVAGRRSQTDAGPRRPRRDAVRRPCPSAPR